MISSRHTNRLLRLKSALMSASVTALVTSLTFSAATAQSASDSGSSQSSDVEQVVVTGSHIVRDGYQAPTPVTVLSAADIQAAAPVNIIDYLDKIPSIVGAGSPSQDNLYTGTGYSGVSTLNLRNLGANRTLVLFDGQRSVASVVTGLVDINTIPQELISRVDIVTGGASSVYGSDALAGVVNFVLDKTYTGLKGELEGGETTYGDDQNWKGSVTYGTGFAADRGHFLVSGEVSDDYGTNVTRSWETAGYTIINNPAYTASNGTPRTLLLPGVGLSEATPGGIITNTALRGTAFGPGGTPYQFAFGPVVSDPFTQGGSSQSTLLQPGFSLDPKGKRMSIFSRVSYDVTDDIQIYGQLQWSGAGYNGTLFRPYDVANITIQASNPFIPASVATQLAALKLTNFTLGTTNADIPASAYDVQRNVNRYVVGGTGKFDALGSAWTWDAYYQYGATHTLEAVPIGNYNKANYTNAINAVVGPNGTVVCASTLTNPTNGCVPYNPMGTGVNSQAAINYLDGTGSYRRQHFQQNVASATVRGEPLSDWAGPISVAFGLENRREAVEGTSDPTSLTGGWFGGSYPPTIGSYTVTEGFAEAVVPVLKDQFLAKSLDVNLAARETGYSVSGLVTTWKAGLTYAPVDDIHFRLTQSRDIRAPNLNDLYQAGATLTTGIVDPFHNSATETVATTTVGNPTLKPEVSETTGLGVVVQPSFIPGLSASIDYYSIDIKNGISSFGGQTVVNLCFQGQQQYCKAITYGTLNGSPVIVSALTEPFNSAQQIARGFDLEGSYQFNLDDLVSSWDGNVRVRALATHYLKNYINDGVNAPYNTVGYNSAQTNGLGSGPPNWTYNSTFMYDLDALTTALTLRGLSSGIYNAANYAYTACTSNCPAYSTTTPTINDNHIPGAFYMDVTLTYTFMSKIDNGFDMSAFFNITNIANKDPAVVTSGPGGYPFANIPTNPQLYDTLGRMFRVGVRANL